MASRILLLILYRYILAFVQLIRSIWLSQLKVEAELRQVDYESEEMCKTMDNRLMRRRKVALV